MYRFDEIDRRIMSALQADASISHNELSQQVGASTASCWRRIKALEEAGVLTKCVRLVSGEKVGRGVNVLCNVRMRSHAPDSRKSFEDFVNDRPEIVESFSMSGEWDYLLRIAVKDVADYDRFIMRGVLAHPSVANAASNFALRQVKYTTAIPV